VSARRRVVLVGAGHAHVEVLRRWARTPPEDAELLLVVDRNPAVYSGMVPGLVAGHYRRAELEIDGAALARRAGGRVLLEPARRVWAEKRVVITASDIEIPFDWASLDVGSTVRGLDLPGVARNAIPARPIDGLIGRIPHLVAAARNASSRSPFRLAVVGAGAGGVELALCFQARLRREAARPVEIRLVDARDRPLEGAPESLRRRVERILARRGVAWLGGRRVTGLEGLEGGSLRLDDGGLVTGDAVVWVPGPAAPAFLAESDLPVDARGFVRIGPTLQVEGLERVFAAGDCASLPGMPKAGVYAVRSGPILAANLRRALGGRPLRPYTPQSDFLSLLNLGDGTAVGSKWGIAFEGRWVMRLKDRIDRRFVERYR